jgi:TRAP-type mannitol/chloroaromatic compound transport system substrate-binding protein
VNDEAGYNRIAPFAVYPGIHSLNSTDFVVRRSKWNALSADQKAAVQTALEEWNIRTMMNQELEDRKAAAKRDPSTLIAWGDKEKLELRRVAQTVWEEWSKRSPLAKEVYDSQVQFLKMMGKL